MNRKRSHDDLEDADECLPISKRINSLHLEGKTQRNCHSQHHLEAVNQLNGYPSNSEPIVSPLLSGQGSIIPFSDHHSNLPMTHHMAAGTDRSHRISSILPDYNVSSNSNINVPPTHSHSQPLLPHFYHGSSATLIPNHTMMNVNGVHHHSNTQSFACSNHHDDHLSMEQQQHRNQSSFYSSQTMNPFLNHQAPLSSCTDVNLVNPQYVGATSDVNHHNTTVAASNLGHVQSHNVALEEELPNGPYEPELGMTENPHYYGTNKLLYEAHLSRLQRIIPDYHLHS